MTEAPAPQPEPTNEVKSDPVNDTPAIKVDPSKDLWANITANVKDAAPDQTEQTVMVLGSKGCGKTSIIYRMLGSSDKPKPTTALEYCYGKREERNATQIANFWELAQGIELAQLSDVVLTPENIHTFVVLIVVDLGDPSTLWETLTFWLKRIDNRAQEVFQRMRAKGSQTPEKMLSRHKGRIGTAHPDLSRLRLMGIPIAIVANRNDLFKSDTNRHSTVMRSLRYIAHLYGASLCVSSNNERSSAKLRSLLNHLIFQIDFDAKSVQLDFEKGELLILPGSDTFHAIGDPTPTNMSGFKPTGDSELDRWKAPFDELFPPSTNVKSNDETEFARLLYDCTNGYGEPAIDAMRRQKDEELEQYRRSTASKKAEGKREKD